MQSNVVSVIEKIKLNTECQNCVRLVNDKGNCKGKKGGSPCLAFKTNNKEETR